MKNFPQFIVIHTVKGFGIVNKAEIDVFLGSKITADGDCSLEVLLLLFGTSLLFHVQF